MEKERLIKVLSITALLISIVSLTIAFTIMSKTLTINGTAIMDTAVWDIHFVSAIVKSKKGDAKEVQAPEITNDGIDLILKVSLRKPKDEIVYNAVIKNAGDIDAEIESIEYSALTEEQKNVLEFEATYEDGTEITEKQELKSKDDITVKIVIRYKDITNESLLATKSYDIPLRFKINYIQKGVDNQNVPSIPEEDTSKSVLFHNTSLIDSSEPFFNSPIKRYIVEKLTFSKGVTPSNNNTWDASLSGDGSIIGYYEDSNNNGYYEVYIESENDIYAPSDSSYLFSEMTSLKEISFNNFKTNDVKNISGMFNYCSSLTNLDLSSFNTSNVTNMNMMFGDCKKLSSVDLSLFNTSNVTNMSYMFWGCSSLISLDLSNFNTSNVTNMFAMFYNCNLLTSLDLSLFDISRIDNITSMFSGCSALKILKFNSADFSDMIYDNHSYFDAFTSCSNITVYVKDETAAEYINIAFKSNGATGTTVIEPLES